MQGIDIKIQNIRELGRTLTDWRAQGLKIAFTNGCFDILHLGHINYLEKAKHTADKLIVGLNSDSSVRTLKGPHRPISREGSRARILASLIFVDVVVIFNEETPIKLIEFVKPDILLKGSDYLAENIVGADIVLANGGEVRTIPLVAGVSTTGLIEKIKKLK